MLTPITKIGNDVLTIATMDDSVHRSFDDIGIY